MTRRRTSHRPQGPSSEVWSPRVECGACGRRLLDDVVLSDRDIAEALRGDSPYVGPGEPVLSRAVHGRWFAVWHCADAETVRRHDTGKTEVSKLSCSLGDPLRGAWQVTCPGCSLTHRGSALDLCQALRFARDSRVKAVELPLPPSDEIPTWRPLRVWREVNFPVKVTKIEITALLPSPGADTGRT